MSTKTILIVIGNSDDKLSQADWAEYISDVDDWVTWADSTGPGVRVHGRWHSYPDTPYQNASWLMVVNDDRAFVVRRLREELPVLCAKYGQDSIAFVTGETDLLGPEGS